MLSYLPLSVVGANGGGFIGVGGLRPSVPRAHIFNLQICLVWKRNWSSPYQFDKYNWEEHPDHFILEDITQAVDFGEGKKSIFAYEGTEIPWTAGERSADGSS